MLLARGWHLGGNDDLPAWKRQVLDEVDTVLKPFESPLLELVRRRSTELQVVKSSGFPVSYTFSRGSRAGPSWPPDLGANHEPCRVLTAVALYLALAICRLGRR